MNGKYKTQLCRNYQTIGTCFMGDRCTFAHGELELRDRPTMSAKSQLFVPKTMSMPCKFFAQGNEHYEPAHSSRVLQVQ